MVYAVLSYQNATDTEFLVRIFGGPGIPVFEHSALYHGSGETDIRIAGRDVLACYVSGAQTQSDALVKVVDRAREASTASAKRVRVASAVNVVRKLDSILAAPERYPLSQTTLDDLQTARDWAARVAALGADIAFDENGRVWVATTPYNDGGSTGGGLAIFEDGVWTSFTAPDIPTWSGDAVTGYFRAVVIDDDGNPWAGTFDTQGFLSSEEWPYVDALVVHREAGQWPETTFPQQGFISALDLAPDGTLWADIGQDGRGDQPMRGGLRVRIHGYWTVATTVTSGLAGNDITALALRANGDVWIGTYHAGLSLIRNAQPGPTPAMATPTSCPCS